MAPSWASGAAVVDATVQGRILDGALACIARVGLAKTTFDDVAREAGSSRATVYRYFSGRAALLAGLVEREADRLRAAVRDAVADASSLEDALIRAAGRAVEHLES